MRRRIYWTSASAILADECPPDLWAGLPFTDYVVGVDHEGMLLYRPQAPSRDDWAELIRELRVRLAPHQRLHLSFLAVDRTRPQRALMLERWWKHGRFRRRVRDLAAAAAAERAASIIVDAETYGGTIWPTVLMRARGRHLAEDTRPLGLGCQVPFGLIPGQRGFDAYWSAAFERVRDDNREILTLIQDPYSVGNRDYAALAAEASRRMRRGVPTGRHRLAFGLSLSHQGAWTGDTSGWPDAGAFEAEAREILRHGDLWCWSNGGYWLLHPQRHEMRAALERLAEAR